MRGGPRLLAARRHLAVDPHPVEGERRLAFGDLEGRGLVVVSAAADDAEQRPLLLSAAVDGAGERVEFVVKAVEVLDRPTSVEHRLRRRFGRDELEQPRRLDEDGASSRPRLAPSATERSCRASASAPS